MLFTNDKQKKVKTRSEQISYRKCLNDPLWGGVHVVMEDRSRCACQPPRKPVLSGPCFPWYPVCRSLERTESARMEGKWLWYGLFWETWTQVWHQYKEDMERVPSSWGICASSPKCGAMHLPLVPCKVWDDKGLPETCISQPFPL